jgi:hypothetical protein
VNENRRSLGWSDIALEHAHQNIERTFGDSHDITFGCVTPMDVIPLEERQWDCLWQRAMPGATSQRRQW